METQLILIAFLIFVVWLHVVGMFLGIYLMLKEMDKESNEDARRIKVRQSFSKNREKEALKEIRNFTKEAEKRLKAWKKEKEMMYG